MLNTKMPKTLHTRTGPQIPKPATEDPIVSSLTASRQLSTFELRARRARIVNQVSLPPLRLRDVSEDERPEPWVFPRTKLPIVSLGDFSSEPIVSMRPTPNTFFAAKSPATMDQIESFAMPASDQPISTTFLAAKPISTNDQIQSFAKTVSRPACSSSTLGIRTRSSTLSLSVEALLGRLAPLASAVSKPLEKEDQNVHALISSAASEEIVTRSPPHPSSSTSMLACIECSRQRTRSILRNGSRHPGGSSSARRESQRSSGTEVRRKVMFDSSSDLPRSLSRFHPLQDTERKLSTG